MLQQKSGAGGNGSGRTPRRCISNRVGIAHCRPLVEDRSSVRQWKGELIIGKNHNWAIVTLAGRCTGFAVIREAQTNNARCVVAAIIDTQGRKNRLYAQSRSTKPQALTPQIIRKALDATVYVANPFCPWGRGTNENYDGLFCQ